MVGALPEWLALVRTAKYLGVAPWELARQPLYWMEWALAAMAIEAEIQGR